MTELVVDWCSYEAAKYAVEHWHYSKSMPAASVKIGVWENDNFIGCVLFALGANRHIGGEYGLDKKEAAELVRIAMKEHNVFVTKVIARSISLIKEQSPGLRLLVSYADGNQEHVGIIYQASNWIYVGEYAKERGIKLNGKIVHRRTINSKYGTSSLEWLKRNIDKNAETIIGKPKYKYLYPLDRAMRRKIKPLAKPYPKSCGRSGEGDTPDDQSGDAGSTPAVRSNITGGVPELVE